MAAFVGKVITASLAGRRIEPVTCEKCGMGFYYELTRVGVGKGSAPYFIGQKSASNRAAVAAEQELARRLDGEAELVPCPKCHWVNHDLIERYRRRQYLGAPLLIVIVMVAGFTAAPLIAVGLTEALGYNSRVPRYALVAVAAVCLLSPAWVLLIRRQLRLRIDPNTTYPLRPRVPAGTPPALVEQRDPRTGKTCMIAVASQDDAQTDQFQWATFRPGQVRLPRLCCVCLDPGSTTYSPPLPVNESSDIAVPLCDRCSVRLQRRWWLTVFIIAGMSMVLGGFASTAVHGIDAMGRWIAFTVIGFFGTVVGGVVIAGRVCRPYRMAVVDRDRGIVKFAAANPVYTAMLVGQIRRSDGVAAR
ncbi:MAG: hypothetical protein JWL69_3244 [Phycisphaerales bacterium]|nr:hypothetical protein [Phycisphaerales bacterium]